MNFKKHIAGGKESIITGFIFLLFIGLIIYNHSLLFVHINLGYIDSDQPFMWAGAADYAKGVFMEPRFYGQNYNTFMEPLFAVPFMWCGLPVYYALPLATHFIFLFPFLFSAGYLFFNNKKNAAILVLAILLCLPPSYDILTSLPRGFVTGIFFSSFFVINFLKPKQVIFLTLNFFMILLGYFVSPNSLLLSLPFLCFVFLHNYKNKLFYLIGLATGLFFIPLYFVFDYFYILHPDYVIYSYRHDFSFSYLLQNLKHPNQAFAHLGFFMDENAIVTLIAFVFLAYVLVKQNKPAFYSLLAFVAILAVMLSSGKSRDGTFWPWYSYSRMYVALPLLLALFAGTIQLNTKVFLIPLVTFCIFFAGYKLYTFKQNVAYHTQEKLWNGVHLVTLKQTLEAIDLFKDRCKQQGVKFFLISNGYWLNTYLDYGGSSVYNDFPETEETNSERRYWVREVHKNKVIPTFVFLSSSYNFDKLMPKDSLYELQRLDDYGLILVKNNRLRMADFIKKSREAEARE